MLGFALRKYIRNILLETSNTACNYISFGFIDDQGNLHDIEEYRMANPDKSHVIDHDSYLHELYGDEYSYERPQNWVVIRNAKFLEIEAYNWWDIDDNIRHKQIDALIEMLRRCAGYCDWIRNNILEEHVDINYLTQMGRPPGSTDESETWPDLIARYGREDQVIKLLELFLPE